MANKEFTRNDHGWVTDELIRENFANRKFNQYYKPIRQNTIKYTTPHAKKFRTVFAVIARIGRDIFSGHDSPYHYVNVARSDLAVTEPRDRYKSQRAVLGQIESALKNIDNKPHGALSFDEMNQPVIKIKRQNFFPSPSQVELDENVVTGRFIVYRRAFDPSEKKDETDYIREYIVIEKRRFGIEARWETRGRIRDQRATFVGLGWFTDGGFWLMLHCADSFKRMRVMAASLAEWQEHRRPSKPISSCTAWVMTHRDRDEVKEPQARRAVLKIEREGQWTAESYDDRLRFLTRAEIGVILSADEMKVLDTDS
ncbi:MAG: hypothetical protein ABL959_21990 [Pyrinomonadaceae bacterium]